MKGADIASLVVLLIVTLGAGWYLYDRRPCAPATYYLAAIDPRFDVSTSTVATLAKKGALLWNDAAGKRLLTYSETPVEKGIPVSLIYDERQLTAQIGQSIDAAQAEDERLRLEIEAASAAYQSRVASYENAKAAYEREAAAYDAEVRAANRAGGATPAQYQALVAKKQSLERTQASLDSQARSLNTQSADLAARVDLYNARVRATNEIVGTFNQEAHKDFNAGEYSADATGRRITIYEFSTQTQLMRVLAHELGHALSVEHTTAPESIMYPYNTSDKAALMEEDKAALSKACDFPQNLIPNLGA